MKKRSLVLAATSLFISLHGYSQKTQMKIAQNAVGKLQAAISNGKDKGAQLSIVGEGIKAVESAQKDRRTKNWPETWAINAYLSSYVAVIDENEANSDKYYAVAVAAIDSARKLDRFQNNTELLEAATNNVIIKKQAKGNRAFQNNEFQAAYNYLKEVSDVYPTDTTLAINTALSAQNLNDLNAALEYYNRAIDNGAANPTLYQAITNIYTSKFETDLAIRTLEQGLLKNAFHPFLMNDYINLLIDNDRHDKAIQVIEKSLTVDSKNKLLYFLYGYLHQLKSRYSTAELAYKRALNIDQNYFDALYQLGITYVNMGNAALKANNVAKDDQSYTAFVNKAETTLLQAHEINPNDQGTVQLLIDIYTRKNRLDKVQDLQRKLQEF